MVRKDSNFSRSANDSRWDDLTEECRLMHMNSSVAKIRLTAEVFMEFGAILYICAALREARFLGLNMFIENLVRTRLIFRFSMGKQISILSFKTYTSDCIDSKTDITVCKI